MRAVGLSWLSPSFHPRPAFRARTGRKNRSAASSVRSFRVDEYRSCAEAHLPWSETTTFVAGLRTTGLTAPMVLDRAKAAATTIDDLWNALAEAIDQFQPDECWNYIKNSEYGSN
jgi:hypothetical protein